MKTITILLILFTGHAMAQGTAGPVTPLSSEIINPDNGYTYLLLSQGDWTDSEAEAVALGGTLATIGSQAEEDWVYDIFSLYGNQRHDLWIGLNDVGQPFDFVWANGAAVTYTDWQPGQPDNGGDSGAPEPYVAIMSFPVASTWADWADGSFDMQLTPFNGVVEIVPEPSIVPLFIAGLVIFALFARNRSVIFRRKTTSMELGLRDSPGTEHSVALYRRACHRCLIC